MSTLDTATASRLAAAAADTADQLADGMQMLLNFLDTEHPALRDLASAARALADQTQCAADTLTRLDHESELANGPDRAIGTAERDLVIAVLQTLHLTFESTVEIYRQAGQRLSDRAAVAQEHWLEPPTLSS